MVVSVLGDEGYKKGVNKFLFPKSLYFGNTVKTITNLSIDFANGAEPVTVLPDQIVNVNYTTLGNKKLNIVVNFSDGTSKNTVADIIPRISISDFISANKVTQSFDETIIADLGGFVPYNTTGVDEFQDRSPEIPGRGDLRIYYDKTMAPATKLADLNISKPVIILDGFDPGDGRTQDSLYVNQFQYDKNYFPSPTSNIVENLVAAGFQVFVLNFPSYKIADDYHIDRETKEVFLTEVKRDGGADYIERNGMVLVKLIQKINQRLGDLNKTDKISIVGPSMGGLISRYALTYMEQRNLNPNTKLWISFDSPHHGANINIGSQIFFKRVSSGIFLKATDKGRDQLKTVAAKQLMIHHYTRVLYPKAGDDCRVIRGHLFHETFFNTINAMGFPQTTCNVALINGRMDGTLQESAPANCGISLYSQTGINAVSILFCAPFMLRHLNDLRFINGFDVRISPRNNEICTVYESSYYVGAIPRKYDVIGNGKATSLDITQGGYYKVNDEVPDYFFFKRVFTNQSFIPTVSSIALINTSGDWNRNLTGINIPLETPFKAIYSAQTANEDHVLITSGAVNFIKAKLLSSTCN